MATNSPETQAPVRQITLLEASLADVTSLAHIIDSSDFSIMAVSTPQSAEQGTVRVGGTPANVELISLAVAFQSAARKSSASEERLTEVMTGFIRHATNRQTEINTESLDGEARQIMWRDFLDQQAKRYNL
jgi:hypothetical protein